MNKKYEEVKQYYSDYGCKLLDDSYKNCDTNMSFRCKCGLIGVGTYRSFKRSKYKSCSVCVAKHVAQANTNDIEYVKGIYEDNGCELLDDYKNNQTAMRFRCYCGNITKKSFSNFRKMPKCKVCSREIDKKQKMFKFEEVKQIFEVNNCILISKEYRGCKEKLEYIASCGHRYSATLDSFMSNGVNAKLCKKCSKKLVSGENNYNWKGGLYNSEKTRFRKSYEFKQWMKSVYKRDNYTCQHCYEKQGELNAHHLDGYNWCEEKRTDVENGVTLCKQCHSKFHHLYGYGDNTKEQFEEWSGNGIEDIKNVVLN